MTETRVVEKLFTLDEIARATGGRVVRAPSENTAVSGVAVDSRKVAEGALFVALAGERTDGHEFLGEAAAAGAAAFLVSEQQVGRRSSAWSGLPEGRGPGVVAVADTLIGLQGLARFHMARFPAVVRVGITGSSGKTTTKEILGAILTRAASTAVNEGNLNSEIGLPLACFAVGSGHRFAVFEMGMNHPGEMDVLADIVRPDLRRWSPTSAPRTSVCWGPRRRSQRKRRRSLPISTAARRLFSPRRSRYLAFLAEGVRGKVVLFGPKSTRGYRGKREPGTGWNAHPLGGVPDPLPALRSAQPRQRAGSDLGGARAGRPERGDT